MGLVTCRAPARIPSGRLQRRQVSVASPQLGVLVCDVGITYDFCVKRVCGRPRLTTFTALDSHTPSNSKRDIRKKTEAYFSAGVQEVWVCDLDGKMTFYSREGVLERSALCPAFPRYVPTTFLR